MAKKSRRTHSRKVRTNKRKSHSRRRTHRKRGGEYAIRGAPASYSLAGNWSSRMSLGQGDDFFKYHQGQHGGEAPVSSIGTVLPQELRGPAHLGGIDKSFQDIAGLKDQTGGKRRKHRKSTKKSKKSKKSKKNRKSRKSRKTLHKRRRGGSLGFAPVSAPGMLLSASEYNQAGLNPAWKSDIAFTDAKIRDTQ